jgi:hypothetical protein
MWMRGFSPGNLSLPPSPITRRTALVPQEGPEIREQETVYPRRAFRTPKGEWVLDFG